MAPVVFLLSRCLHPGSGESVTDNRYSAFTGSAACASCHPGIYQQFVHTAHFLDSRPARAPFVNGSFSSDSNRLVYANGSTLMMEHAADGFFQTLWRSGKQVRRTGFGIVIGSGKKGQSFLYWEGDELFQLPASYFTPTHSWCNSPGFPIDSPLFNRRVSSFCLECHTTYAQAVFHSPDESGDFFDSSRMCYGIGCEKCHGPGRQHVMHYEQATAAGGNTDIVNPRSFSRQQKLDLCALCHSGRRIPLKRAFSFQSGDTLDQFSEPAFLPENIATLDVHANQYGLLTSSKCFMKSFMDCTSCHDPHQQEAGNIQVFSQRCLSCHNGADHPFCSFRGLSSGKLKEDCVDCHMPELPSGAIILQMTGAKQDIANLVRTHRIAIYPDYTSAYIKNIRHLPSKPGN
ncbi:MAG TPA: multiheme c-type cytochrome [Puia sp.]|nr:multiheme c-type cytochrome [Puia sp.]